MSMKNVLSGSPWLVALALAACGHAASWPMLTGRETLDQLRAAHDQKMKAADGKQLLASWVACGNRDATACQWLSAFWQADYDDAVKACDAGDADRCFEAASYALRCEVRGVGSGSERVTREFSEEDTGPGCERDVYGVPFDLVKLPPFDVGRALELMATSCKKGTAKDAEGKDSPFLAASSCKQIARVLLSGLAAGIEVPQDFDLARKFFDRALQLEQEEDESAQRRWKELAGAYLDESPAERRARIRRVQTVYEQEAATDRELASMQVELENHSSLDAIAAGLSAGLATNAAVNSSLETARSNIQATVSAAQHGKGGAVVAPPGPATAPAAGLPAKAASVDKPGLSCASGTDAGGKYRACKCVHAPPQKTVEYVSGWLSGGSATTVSSCPSSIPCCFTSDGSQPNIPLGECQCSTAYDCSAPMDGYKATGHCP